MTIRILTGDALAMLRTLPDECVQTCITSPPYFAQRDYLAEDDPAKEHEIGSEETPEAFVERLVEVFREVRRVLRRDGTLWLNIGDTAASGGRGGGGIYDERNAWKHGRNAHVQGWRSPPAGLKRKDLIGIPWMLAFAMRADGWFLRSEIIWSKPNAFPESVYDRPTRAHEQVFLFAKSGRDTIWRARDTKTWCTEPDLAETLPNPRHDPTDEKSSPTIRRWQGFDYYYDQEAIFEQSSPNTHARAKRGRSLTHKHADGGPGNQTIAKVSPSAGRVPGATPKAEKMTDAGRVRANSDFMAAVSGDVLPMRNKRSVWEVHTAQFSDSHYATFPPALVEPCVLAGAPRGGVVLDPFAGSGTVGQVAATHGREAILIDLDHRNVRMMEDRLRDLQLALPV